MNFTDAAPLTGTNITDEGYIEAVAFTVRTGVQHYHASEVGLSDSRMVAVYRPAAEVFSKDSVTSFARKPVTVDHPASAVGSENWRDLAVGETDSEILRDGERLRIPMTIRAADAIAAINAGKRELSAGYVCDLDWTAGVTEDGQPYEAVQRKIRANHIAIVAQGRAGSEFRIGDGAVNWGATPITSDTKEAHMADALKTVVLGDKAVSVSIADAAEIEAYKLAQARVLSDAAASHDKAIAAKDADLATKDATIADLTAKVLSDAALDARVADRAALVGRATALVADVQTAGKSDADIRKAVVIAKRGAAMADKSAAYIDAAFDLLAEAAPVDAVRQSMGDTQATPATLDAAYTARNAGLADAWKTPMKKEA